VIVNFIRDPAVGLFARAKRRPGAAGAGKPPKAAQVLAQDERETGEAAAAAAVRVLVKAE
jgi:hypothetical protein